MKLVALFWLLVFYTQAEVKADSAWIDDPLLNGKDLQLAKLHGLGPQEISALSSWQRKLLRRNPPTDAELPVYLPEAGSSRTVPEVDPFVRKRSSTRSKSTKDKQQRKGNSNRDKSANPQPEVDSANPVALPVVANVGRINKNLAAQFLLRSPRENRKYDVPIIECPPAEDGMERFACPTKDRMDRYRCIDDHVLCDGFVDCPGAEDEDRQACMFYKTMKAHLDVVADALLRWVHGR